MSDTQTSFPSSDFAEGGTICFITEDGCLPWPECGTSGLYVFGDASALRPDHPLRQLLPDEECYWIEGPLCESRRLGYVLGTAILDDSLQLRPPDAIDLDTAVALTRRAAQAKNALRRQALQESLS